MSIMEPKYIIRVVMDTIILLTVAIPILLFFLLGQPVERGFHCDDESLRYPYKDSTVSTGVLYAVGTILPTTAMVLLEGWRARHQPIGKSVRICNRRINSWMWGCYTAIGVFLFGCACSQLTTDIAKYSVGRLRPHFVSICKPDWTQIDCVNNTYVDPIPCTTPKENHRMKEARLSFPSGHASFSAYTMVYLAIYLQVRFKFKAPRLLRPFLQFLCLMLTFYTTLSRISDYKHHWSDVLSGFILGTVVATLIARYVSDLFITPIQAQCSSQGHPVYLQDRRLPDTDSEANNTVNPVRTQTAMGTVSE
ncbi:putative phosphatidate phosphatase isoform X1 [Portunus trituberculatus]|uniref:putative phosphatidate phosphatase isoform X1 n=1 Tax=Portunus trituberculatus TaxID=210409 RepID=UPI001E1CBDEC|nr:putative phosphatidate phosphatase isoform X1 [Portunus trituberculatus]